jgi:hypothetical protein
MAIPRKSTKTPRGWGAARKSGTDKMAGLPYHGGTPPWKGGPVKPGGIGVPPKKPT